MRVRPMGLGDRLGRIHSPSVILWPGTIGAAGYVGKKMGGPKKETARMKPCLR